MNNLTGFFSVFLSVSKPVVLLKYMYVFFFKYLSRIPIRYDTIRFDLI